MSKINMSKNSLYVLFIGTVLSLALSFFNQAHADISAPMLPPELSDTLTDYRTKQQLRENVYIEGQSDPKNSLNVPSLPGDLESKVLRLSAMYHAQYEIAVPHNGIAILRIYDLNGFPMEILSTRVENQAFLADITAAPSEIMIRQLSGASSTLLSVRLKGIEREFIFTLKPLALFNQQRSIKTVINAMTVNYYVEGVTYNPPQPYKFKLDSAYTKQEFDFAKLKQNELKHDLLKSTSIVLPLSLVEMENAKTALQNILSAHKLTQEQELKAKMHKTSARVENKVPAPLENNEPQIEGKKRIYSLE